LCDACELLNDADHGRTTFDRRALLRTAMIGGAALAARTLWTPSAARASSNNDGSSTIESASMAEDPAATSANSAGTTGIRGTRLIPPPNIGGYPAPSILTRAQWGADESIRGDTRSFAPIRKLIVHHTASANRPSDPASVVRLVDQYHTTGRGYSDTGYNYLIDHKGVIYEGRAARRYAAKEPVTGEDFKGWGVVGAHAKGYNAGSCGICLIGDFETATPSDAALSSLVSLLSYKASRHRIDAHGKEEYIDMYGGHHVFPNISGHRQVGQTLCPGAHLFSMLPRLRDEVSANTGKWAEMVVDIPDLIRYEYGHLRNPAIGSPAPASTARGTASASATTDPTTSDPTTDPTTTIAAPTTTDQPTTTDVATTTTTPTASTTTPPTQTVAAVESGRTPMIGVRILSRSGTVYTVGAGTDAGTSTSSGLSNVVALASTSKVDGYWVLGADGKVAASSGLKSFGDTTGKGTAADMVCTSSGAGYWVLLADGGIYPFGDARYASSPKREGLGGKAVRMAARPQGDGYWTLMSDGTVHAFGNAAGFGPATGAGTPLDLCPTSTGAGYWILTDQGRVLVFGDAVDKGDLKRSKVKWSKQVARILATPTGKGYLIISTEGAMLAFGDAATVPSLGGSGITLAGATPAFG
jgi:hypothetical protein